MSGPACLFELTFLPIASEKNTYDRGKEIDMSYISLVTPFHPRPSPQNSPFLTNPLNLSDSNLEKYAYATFFTGFMIRRNLEREMGRHVRWALVLKY
jgi:hypothetical protein